MGRRNERGFTLVELLIVVTIISMLAGLLLPTVGRAMEQGRRSACASNIKEIVRACRAYSLERRWSQGTTAYGLPTVKPASGNWHLSNSGNRACLWLTIKYNYASPGIFVCPSLKAKDHQIAKVADGQFDAGGNLTCGYSYISMVDRGNSGAPPVLSADDAYPAMVIVADKNPRFNAGSKSVVSGTSRTTRSNSHRSLGGQAEGQNVGRLDESGAWLETPVVLTGTNRTDWIWEPVAPGSDGSGRAGGKYDVFLIP